MAFPIVPIIQGLAMLAQGIAGNRAAKKQVEAQKELSKHNQQIGMQNWQNTNFAAQVEQMKKAGLNVGMMYSGAGGHGMGQTAAGSTGQAPTPDLSNIGGLALQNELIKAQKENIEADTKLKLTDAEKKSGVDTTEAQGRIAKLAEETTNTALRNALQEIENSIAKQTEVFNVQEIQSRTEAAVAAAGKATNEKNISDKTIKDIIEQTQLATIEKQLQIESQKAGLKLTAEQIKKVTAEIPKIAAETDHTKQKIMIEQAYKEFQTGNTAEAIRIINALVGTAKELHKMGQN